MKLPNWFRIIWWGFLVAVLLVYHWQRWPELIAGRVTAFDGLALVVLVCLSLAPIFSEITVLGFTLKQRIEDVKKEVQDLKADIRNSLSLQSQINPNINILTPPPDYKLPEIESQVQRAIANELQRLGKPTMDTAAQKADVPQANLELFQVRFSIERELGRIHRERFGVPDDWPGRPLTADKSIGRLVESQLISPELGNAIREVYAVCSAAIHGKDVSEAKVGFVNDVAPGLLTALRSL